MGALSGTPVHNSCDIAGARRHPASCEDAEQCRVTLDVNGVTYKTTQQTLCSVKGSRFPDLLGTADYTAGGKKLCIDRNGQVTNAENAELRRRPSYRGAQSPCGR